MKVQPINNTNRNYNTNFGAKLLRDNVLLTNKETGKSVRAAIIELETETRELIADARQKYSMGIYEHGILKKTYRGDYEFMDGLTRTNNQDILEINNRVQARKNIRGENMTAMSDYLSRVTGGKMRVMPEGGYGLSDRSYVAYLSNSQTSPLDGVIYNDRKGTGTLRQRVLMAIEPQEDYRNINPDAEVFAVSEIYTDRVMDAVEDMTTDETKRMAEIIKADEEYDKLFQQYIDGGKTDKELEGRLDRMSFDICSEFAIPYSDFMLTRNGKKYIKSDEEIFKTQLNKFGLSEQNVIPVIINKLLSLNSYIEGAQNALMEVIEEKGIFRGVFSERYGGNSGFCKNPRYIE